MTRRLRVLLAVLIWAAAVVTTTSALDQTTLVYYLPVPAGQVTRHSAVFVPAVVAAVVAGLVAVAALAFVVLNLVRRPSRRSWLVLLGLLATAVAVLAVVANLPRPTF